MRRIQRAFAVLAMLAALAAPTGAQWSPGGVTGGTKHLGVGFDTLAVPVAKARYTMKDTTNTGDASVHRVIAYNDNDPNDLGVYVGIGDDAQLIGAFDRARTAELNNALWRVEQILVPTMGTIEIAAGDSLVVRDLTTWEPAIIFAPGVDNIIQDATPGLTGVAYQDRRIWVSGTGGADLTMIDLWADAAYKWDTSGFYVYQGDLSERNDGNGWLLMNASPAIVNNTVNAVAVARSPFSGMAGMDAEGRQRAYWSVGTDVGISKARRDQYGMLYIDDSAVTTDVDFLTILPAGDMIFGSDGGFRDLLYWLEETTSTTGDGNMWDEIWANNGTGSELLNWGDAVVFSDFAALPGRSAMGNNSWRGMLGSDVGVYLIDAKARDNENGSKQEITSTYRTPGLLGSVAVAFAGESSADPTGQHPWTNNGAVTFVSNTDGPGGSYGNFVAASSQSLTIPDHADFTFTDAFTAQLWIYRDLDSGSAEGLFSHSDNGDANDRAFLINITVADLIEVTLTTAGPAHVASVGPAIATGQWHFVVATYDGATLRLYLNGDEVDSDAQTGDMIDSLEPLCLAAYTNAGTPAFFFDGRIWGASATPTVASPEWIKVQYQQGLANMQSPFRGVLPEAAVVRVDAEPISGRFAILGATVASVWDEYAALLDTFHCTGCGTLADVAIPVVPGCDSVSVVFGGATGMRAVTPNVRLVDMAMWEFPTWSENWVGNGPVVADSSGWGHTWKVQDAIDMATNVGLRNVDVLKGTYNDPVTDVYTNMRLTGIGWPLVTNASSTGNEAMLVATGDSVTIDGFWLYTAPGGGGGGKSTFDVSAGADYGVLRNVQVLDSDAAGIEGQDGDFWLFEDCVVLDSDATAFLPGAYSHVRGGSYSGVTTPRNLNGSIIGAVFSGAPSVIYVNTLADSMRFVGNQVAGDLVVSAGATGTIIMGNSIQGYIFDNGTNTTLVGNVTKP